MKKVGVPETLLRSALGVLRDPQRDGAGVQVAAEAFHVEFDRAGEPDQALAVQ